MTLRSDMDGTIMPTLPVTIPIVLQRVLCLLIIVVSCNACQSSQTAIPEEWQTRWLRNTPCQLPCWEGITPGQTTASEAILHLKQLPFIADVTTENAAPGLGIVKWSWRNYNGVAGRAYFFGDTTATAQPIFSLGATYPTPLKLSDIITAYGQPTHIQAGALPTSAQSTHRFNYLLVLFYKSQRLKLIVQEGAPSVPPLNSDMTIASIAIDAPDQDILSSTDDRTLASQGVIPWQGFHDFMFYCRNLINGQTCQK